MTDQPKMSRQVRRANERRANKPEPGPIALTSTRWLGRTKGQPYSRMMLKDTIPGRPGRPATLKLIHPTRRTGRYIQATPRLVDLFFPAIPDNFRASMLGY